MKTTIIKSNGVRDGTEERVTQNWAAEYAKRLVDKEAYERKKADDDLSAKIDNHAKEWATGTKCSHVSLSDSVSSTLGISGATAATPYAVKKAYDKGVEGVNVAEEVQVNLNEEISDRQSGDSILQGKIDAEESQRKNADNVLQRNINVEISNRQRACAILQDNIDSEKTNRINSDNILGANIEVLQSNAHIHGNMDILDGITSERVKSWDGNVDFAEYKAYMELTVFGIVNELKRLYTSIGVNHYDGGLFGMIYDDAALDGGSFGEAASGMVDCGGFEPISLPLGM